MDDEIDEHDDDISGFGWDLPSGEYAATPEPGERSRHSPLSGSESDIITTFRVDTSDEDDEVRSLCYCKPCGAGNTKQDSKYITENIPIPL